MQYLAAVAALQRQSTPVDLLPYLAAAHRLPVLPPTASQCAAAAAAAVGPLSPAAAPARLKPSPCSDPRCSRCLAGAATSRGGGSSGPACAGCSHCAAGHPHHQAHPSASSGSSSVLAPGTAGGHGAFAAALSALSRLPAGGTADSPGLHTCNWLHPGGAYCGQRFSSVDDLMSHLHSHCGTTTEPAAALLPAVPDLHPVAAGSLFAPLAVLYGAAAASSYAPGLDLVPPGVGPSAPAVSPSTLLRHHQQHHAGLAAAAAARYHPYRVPPCSLLPPSAAVAPAAYPSSLAAYYGALCGVAPAANGTVPAVRL